MDLNKLEPMEKSRTYHRYNKKESTTFENVTHFKASMTTHRLMLADGTLIIVPLEDLKYIEIKADGFTL